MHVAGHMIEVDYDGQTMRIHGRNKASRVALNGEQHEQDVILPRAEIATLRLKPASILTNGRLDVTTHAGRRYQLHFRRRQVDGFRQLTAALQA